jgi:hypothetical protein
MGNAMHTDGTCRADDVRILDRAGNRRLPVGDDGFERVVERSVFVDKSMLIADVLQASSTATLFCRPRRFGKTLAMTMLKAFLEIPVDGADRTSLFEGLAIWDAEDGHYRCEQGVRPVVYLSLNDIKKGSWEQAYEAFAGKVAAEYERHGYLAQSELLSEAQRAQFERVRNQRGSRADVESSLRQLCLYLQRHHGRNVVVLVDEYDAPVMVARERGYYREMVDFMKGWLTGALKDGGAALDFACLTGVQRIAKESIFSDLNNLVVDTSLNRRFDERFGFTEAEVAALAAYLGRSDRLAEVKDWYDGYRFGDTDIYNPWSVLNYFANFCEPGVYWANTASNTVVADAVHNADEGTLGDVFALLQPGGTISKPLDMGAVFLESGERGTALWSLLYLAGYLTTSDVADSGNRRVKRALRLPNREVAEVFRTEVVERFEAEAGGADRLEKLYGALTAGNAEKLQGALVDILEAGPSCRDLTSENSYHMFVAGLLFGVPGYGSPLSNREEGDGFYDLQLTAERTGRPQMGSFLPAITLEFKFTKSKSASLPKLAQSALQQIEHKGYDRSEPAGALRYGIAFHGKDAAVVFERKA